MEFVILDLEWNGTYSRRKQGFINEIIEFGAVKCDESLQIVDTFSSLVKPQVGKKISGKVKTLTSITNEELAGGRQFMQVQSYFRKWMGDAVLLTWGTSDILTLIENYQYFCGNDKIPFLTGYVDLQKYCEDAMEYGSTQQMGLSTAAQLLNIDEEGIDHHRALDDSLLSLKCLHKLYDKEKLLSYVQDATRQEFYDRMTFKTVIITDLGNPHIHRSDLLFRCENCGKLARRLEPWNLRNKSFRAPFECRTCHHKFVGRVQFKLKYEGLVVKKKICPWQEKKKPDTEAPQEETAENQS